MDPLAFGGKQVDGLQCIAALAEAVGILTPPAPHGGEDADAGDNYVVWILHGGYWDGKFSM